MQILIIGNGGREHALAWKVAQSTSVHAIYVAPGNAGTAQLTKTTNVSISPLDTEELIDFAHSKAIDLTIVGPEAPLANGISDAFHAAGLNCFGPNKMAAQLEASKTWSKAFMQRHGIPTADHMSFDDLTKAKTYLETAQYPIVIKADGLAAGKGVVIAEDKYTAQTACDAMLAENQFGEAGQCVVIESYLTGEEASFMVMVDGTDFIPFATSQDHKARDEGDTGPNTGGMGAYSPAPVITDQIEQQIIDDIIKPTLAGLKADGITYQGFLYAGLMIDDDGRARVLEYNCRLGDPETQVLMMRLQSDLTSLCQACLTHRLSSQTCQWDPRPALGVVLAAGGYPHHYEKHDPIAGLPATPDNTDTVIFHAGTCYVADRIVTNGGRVLCVCALGDDIHTARDRAYQQVSHVHWKNQYYRKDIGHKAIARSR